MKSPGVLCLESLLSVKKWPEGVESRPPLSLQGLVPSPVGRGAGWQ